MKLTYVWVLALTGTLGSCNQASQNKLFTAAGLSSLSSGESKAYKAIEVHYTLGDTQTDSISFSHPEKLVDITDETLSESSGLAPSYRNSGCLWTEQDSGNSNQIQLLNQDGTVVARFTLKGVENKDWEDIAVGPGPVPGETYIYLAEIGDNKHQYTEKIIYRFPEPVVAEHHLPVEGEISRVEAIRLQLPDGPQNSEAILLDPLTKDLFLLSKGTTTLLYRAAFPQPVNRPKLMTLELALPFENITSAAVSADGREILIRNYKQLFHYTRQSGESITEALKRPPHLVSLANEAQGEAVGWAVDGSGYYTTSEETFRTTPALYFYRRIK